MRAFLLPPFLLPTLTLASLAVFDGTVILSGHKYDFTSLSGRHEIHASEFINPSYKNTTYAINPTNTLNLLPGEKEIDFCGKGAQVCIVERTVHPPDLSTGVVARVINVAGNFGGKPEEVTYEAIDGKTEKGVRVLMAGGLHKEKKQRAVVEYICDPDRTGLEGTPEVKDGDKKDDGKKDGDKKDDEKKGDGDKKDDEKKGDGEKKPEKREEKKDDTPSLTFVSYDTATEPHTLTLRWLTKHACENEAPSAASGWGFFTWLIIILFMLVAAYLIFGSWLNYNRYGARGWDLLPHADTIRDLPYLARDFARSIGRTLKGSGRGGYSAV